jgi:chemotaxis protein CheZ
MSTCREPPLGEADYEAIEDAVLETARGRWFLAEHARRNRQAETARLLAALDRIETAIRRIPASDAIDRIRGHLAGIAAAMARTRREVDRTASTGEMTTPALIAVAERIQDVTWILRDRGAEDGICDLLDGLAVRLIAASRRQDALDHDLRRLIAGLRDLDGRIAAMVEASGIEVDSEGTKVAAAHESHQAPRSEGIVPSAVEGLLPPGADGRERAPAAEAASDVDARGTAPAPHASTHEVSTPAGARAFAKMTMPHGPDAAAPTRRLDDPLAAIAALSFEEKVALFS